MTQLLALWLGAAVGAPARYLTDRAVQSRHDSVLPWGTLTVNVVGSLVLGLLTGVAVHHAVAPVATVALGTGFCGALTTYSTFSYETMRLVESRSYLLAGANVALSLVGGMAAAAAGYLAGSAL